MSMLTMTSPLPDTLSANLPDIAATRDLVERIRRIEQYVSGRIVFTTSFGIEDQALTRALVEARSRAEIVTLDTGRLFPETYDTWVETEEAYNIRIHAYVPERAVEEAFVARRGINGFRHTLDAREECCGFRKVEPLRRALAGAAVWYTGLRAGQSAHRAETPIAQVDAGHGVIKVSPLADWSRDDVDRYIHEYAIPYNILHDRGFPSIGCAPCTRAVRVGESERAGRWWWEQEAKKECGLHLSHPAPDAAIIAGDEAAAFESANKSNLMKELA